MPLPELSLGWLSLPHASPTELVSAAAHAGFASVSLRVAAAPGDPVPALSTQPQPLREVGAALADTGVRVAEMGSIRLQGPLPSSWCLPSLEVGARLGADTLIALVFEPDPHKRLDDVRDLCEAARPFGLRVAIEFAAFTSVPTVEEALALALASGLPNAGLAVDALHLARSGGSPADLAHVPAERVFLAQLCDARAQPPADQEGLRQEARTDRLDPGFGALPLGDFVRRLPTGLALELEIPCRLPAPMTPAARARQMAERARHFLSTVPRAQPQPAR